MSEYINILNAFHMNWKWQIIKRRVVNEIQTYCIFTFKINLYAKFEHVILINQR
jgi:hypothetical protein